MKTKHVLAMGILIIYALLAIPRAASRDGPTVGADLVLAAGDFQSGTHEDVIATAEGLSLLRGASVGQYTSDVIEAPISFNAVVPRWLGSGLEIDVISIRLRTGTASGVWSDWYSISLNHDWMHQGDENAVGQMITVPTPGDTHKKLQFSVNFDRSEGQPPAFLQQIQFTFIDSSAGPTTEELIARQEELDRTISTEPTDGYPKPSVISRQVWCTDPACNYSDGLEYAPVTHLIIHHTVSNNDSSDWAAVVRAIWYYHAVTLDWDDIGYNYLVDMDGVLYEGHLGGDDVVGIHAGGANTGSMALSLIGTFTKPEQTPSGISPPPAMLESAIELLAWKADQKQIDVFDASHLPYVDWGLPHLMGHRDVYGTTVCPGDLAHEQLHWIREQVAGRINFESPYQHVDEMSGAFTKSDADWHTPPGGCGFAGHAYYAWSTTTQSSAENWGEWRPALDSAGTYEVEVYAPYCITGTNETGGATYTINHVQGTDTAIVSHEANVGTWMSLGSFDFSSGTDGSVQLTNLSTTDSTLGVWFDAIRLSYVKPLASNLYPLDRSWSQNRDILFVWSISSPLSVSSTLLEVATDEAFSNIVFAETITDGSSSHSHNFDQDYSELFWHVVITTSQGGVITSPSTSFGIDTVAPSSKVAAIFSWNGSGYLVLWSGLDQTSGLAAYNVDFQAEGETAWTQWLAGTDKGLAQFIPPDGKVYWFRSQATDWAGNVEPAHPAGDLSTADAIELDRAIMLPLISR